MARCEILAFAVCAHGHSPGAARIAHQCKTHGMLDTFISDDGLCPIGRIEDATDKAIERIRTEKMTAPHGNKNDVLS